MRLITKPVFILITISLLFGCAGIPGNNVKLEKYPKVKKESVSRLNLKYSINYPKTNKNNFDRNIIDYLSGLDLERVKESKNNNQSCIIKLTSNDDYGQSKVCQAYGILAGMTLFTIPAYCYWNYEAKANLISTPKPSEIRGIIKPSIDSANQGDLFLDESDNPRKLLKKYHLKDKVHEVWSLIWMLNPWSWDEPAPESGKRIVKERISEALARQIIHDANQFKECQKAQ